MNDDAVSTCAKAVSMKMDEETREKSWRKINAYLTSRHFMEEDIYRNGNFNHQQTSISMLSASSIEADVKRVTEDSPSFLTDSDFYKEQLDDYIKTHERFKEEMKPESSYPLLVIREFLTFRHYVEHGVKPKRLKMELSSILYPLFCKFYIQLIEKHDEDYEKFLRYFLKQNEDLFPSHDFGVKLKSEILSLHRKEQLVTKSLTQYFRSKIWNIELSKSSVNLLTLFMKKREYSMILANAFNIWFNFEQITSESESDDDEDELQNKGDYGGLESSDKKDEVMNEKEENFKKLLVEYRDKLSWSSCLSVYELHNSEQVSCSTISLPYGILACGTLKSDIKLWNISGKETFLNESISHAIQLHGIGSYNYAQMEDENVQSEDNFVTLRGHYGPISMLTVLNGMNMLLSTSQDKCMRAWNLETGMCSTIYRGHSKPLTCLDVSCFNLYVATGSVDNTARLWMLDKVSPLRIYAGHIAPVTCVKFHPNGVYLATGSVDKTIRLFDVKSGTILRVFTGHTGNVYCVEFSPSGLLLASGGDDYDVRIWEVATSQQLLRITVPSIPVSYLQWDPSSMYLFVTLLEDYISVWKLKSDGKNAEEVFDFSKPKHRFTSCEYFSDKNILACVAIKSKEKME